MEMVMVAFSHDELEALTTFLSESIEATRRVGYPVGLGTEIMFHKFTCAHALLCPSIGVNVRDQAEVIVRDRYAGLIERVDL